MATKRKRSLEEVVGEEPEEGSATQALLDATDGGDPEEVGEYLYDLVDRLFKDAKVRHKRTSAR
jgi:hypothetical protein